MAKIFRKFSVALTLFMLVLTLSGCTLFQANVYDREAVLPNSSDAAFSVEFSTHGQEREALSRTQAVALVERSVVAIIMEKTNEKNEVVSVSYGSGVIVDINDTQNPLDENEFYLLTCHHVISGAENITVCVPDMNCRNYTDEDYDDSFKFSGVIGEKSGEITLVGSDKKADVGVLKLDLTNTGVTKDKIVAAKAPVSGYQIKRGEDVFSIGNPSGKLPGTVSAGIVSYLDREAVINSIGYMNLMQIDVQINHGNSGGGLFNLYGELVGITNAGSETLDGINYAIPYKTGGGEDNGFINVAKQLIASKTADNFGYVSGRWALGITIASAKTTTQEVNQILAVAENSISKDAGLAMGDIVVGVKYVIDDEQVVNEVKTSSEFNSVFYILQKHFTTGDSFVLVVLRGEETVDVTIQITRDYIFCDTGAAVGEGA